MLGLAIPLRRASPPACAAALARARCAARLHHEAGAEQDAAPSGSGCFDSSFDLHAGLTVVEHDGLHGDSLALAVALWLR